MDKLIKMFEKKCETKIGGRIEVVIYFIACVVLFYYMVVAITN